MSDAQSYYDSLLTQGYTPDQAMEYTHPYFPHFVPSQSPELDASVDSEKTLTYDLAIWKWPARVTLLAMFVALTTFRWLRNGYGNAIPLLQSATPIAEAWNILFAIFALMSIILLIRATILFRKQHGYEKGGGHELVVGLLIFLLLLIYSASAGYMGMVLCAALVFLSAICCLVIIRHHNWHKDRSALYGLGMMVLFAVSLLATMFLISVDYNAVIRLLILVYLVSLLAAWKRASDVFAADLSTEESDWTESLPYVPEMKWPIRLFLVVLILEGLVIEMAARGFNDGADLSNLFPDYASDTRLLLTTAFGICAFTLLISSMFVLTYLRRKGEIDNRLIIFDVRYLLIGIGSFVTASIIYFDNYYGMILAGIDGGSLPDLLFATMLALPATYYFLRSRALGIIGDGEKMNTVVTSSNINIQDRFTMWLFAILFISWLNAREFGSDYIFDFMGLSWEISEFMRYAGRIPAILFWVFVFLAWSEIRRFTEMDPAKSLPYSSTQSTWPPWYADARLLPLVCALMAMAINGLITLGFVGSGPLWGENSRLWSEDIETLKVLMFLYLVLLLTCFGTWWRRRDRTTPSHEENWWKRSSGFDKTLVAGFSILVIQGLILFINSLIYSAHDTADYFDAGDGGQSGYYTARNADIWELIEFALILWWIQVLLMLGLAGFALFARFKRTDDTVELDEGDERDAVRWFTVGALLWMTTAVGLLLKEQGYSFYYEGASLFDKSIYNDYGSILLALYYSLLILAIMCIKTTISKQHWIVPEMTPLKILQVVQESNELGVKTFRDGDYIEAERAFRRSEALIRRGIAIGHHNPDAQTIVETLKMMKAPLQEKLENARNGAISQRINASFDELEKQIDSAEEDVSNEPVAAKRAGDVIIKELYSLRKQVTKNELKDLENKCTELLKRIEEVIGAANKDLMGGLHISKTPATISTPPAPNVPAISEMLPPPIAPSSPMSEVLESDILQRFVRGVKIKDGGMAEIYEARDKYSGQDVIWKQAAPDRMNPLTVVNKALDNESEILSELNSSRIPTHIGTGMIDDTRHGKTKVLVIERIEGIDLANSMLVLKARGRTEELDLAIKTILEICEALEYMAEQDPPVYHRDIKPHNIILHPSRGAVLIDFGLAKGVEAGMGFSHTGGAGTEGYKPPERDRGISGNFTDVYSLGQLFWVLLSGEDPFHAMDIDEIAATLNTKGHPTWLAGLIFSSVQRHDRRIQTVTEFRLRLQNKGELP
jgi:tRNA A-37 threonylcarbamoyl transferase component Bud32